MITIRIEGKKAQIQLDETQKKIRDLRPFFTNFVTYMQSVSVQMFRRLKKGGQYRGIKWPCFAPQYRRKDGTLIHAEGGVLKVKGQGVVKGRLRQSGERVDSSSNLMRDTGRLQSAALNWVHKSKSVLVMDTRLQYAGYQNQLRPFAFFQLPNDEKAAVNMFNRFLG